MRDTMIPVRETVAIAEIPGRAFQDLMDIAVESPKSTAQKKTPPKKQTKTGQSSAKKISPVYQLNITLVYVDPPIFRRLLVRGDASLGLLHAVIQVAMGWTNSHLHQFTIGNSRYSDPRMNDDIGLGDEPDRDEHQITLQEALPKAHARFVYVYDFGDSWEHFITVETIGSSESLPVGVASCIGGMRACPPEDCGGVPGYENLLEVIKRPKHKEYRHMMEWLGGKFDPEAFDVEKINRCLRKLKWPRMTDHQLAKVLMERDGCLE